MVNNFNFIEVKRDGDDVLIAFHPRDGQKSQWRWVDAQEALSLGLLLSTDAPTSALKFDTESFSLQVENHPYQRAWMMMSGVRGGRSRCLSVCIEDGQVPRVGIALRTVSSSILTGKNGRQRSFRCKVHHFYVDRHAQSGASG